MKKLTLLFAAILIANLTHATIWRVNNIDEVDADFTTAQDAHDGASAGDTLYFENSPDSYGDLVSIKQLVIIGPGYFLDENEGNQADVNPATLGTVEFVKEVGVEASQGVDAVSASTSAGSTIIGMTISTLYSYTPNNTIKRNNINNCILNSGSTNYSPISAEEYTINGNNAAILQNYIYYLQLVSSDNIVVSNNIITGYLTNNEDYSNNITISNNIFTYSGTCLKVYNATLTNNILINSESVAAENSNNTFSYNIAVNSDGWPQDADNTNQNGLTASNIIVATGSTDGYYQLVEGGDGEGSGYEGADCGPFGGSSPYVLSGIPAIPSIYEFIMPGTGTQSDGIKVTIKAKANQ